MKTKFNLSFLALLTLGFFGLNNIFSAQEQSTAELLPSVLASEGQILLVQQNTPSAETVSALATDDSGTKEKEPVEKEKNITPPKKTSTNENTEDNRPKVEEVTPTMPSPASTPNYTGNIVYISPQKDFVVVDFKEKGNVPPIRSELGVYRNEQFVASIRITNPVKPPLASADIIQGAPQQGDVVR